MPGVYKRSHVRIALLSLCFFLQAQGYAPLVGPTGESYKQKSHTIGHKLEREFYVRAAALTASGFFSIYCVINCLMGSEKIVEKAAEVVKQAWPEWLASSAVSVTKACAQAICVQWLISKVTTNNAEPQIYIAKQAHYKIHCLEIDRLLADEYLENKYGHVDLLIQGHLQAMVDKIELLMAYMLYYGSVHTLPHAYAHIEIYTAEVIQKVHAIVEQFNTTQAHNFVNAVKICKKECADLLIASIRYALASLPCDD